jgi:hypothetical protein
MGEEAKQLTLICSEIGARDYMTEADVDGRTFNDITEFLKKRYDEPIIAHVKAEVGHIIPRQDRIVLKYSYADASGGIVPIEPTDQVQDIMSINDTVNWSIEPYGG